MRHNEKREIRVIVWPEPIWGIGHLSWEDRELREVALASLIKKSVERHVDNVSSVEVKWDLVEVCDFCRYETHESERELQVIECCQAAIDEFAAAGKPS